ncbi:MAG: nucleotidyltransferase domain-containing protein [Candidatus Paceibacterota bacterium]
MNKEFSQKMMAIRNRTVKEIVNFFKVEAIEAHILGSLAKGTNDALSDVDIWLTFEDEKMPTVLEKRMATYAQFGQIILLNEMPNNFPLNGVQTAVLYKISGELLRVDFYLCPLSSSRILPGSKILFANKEVPVGSIIPETKKKPGNISDRITFLISMCFIAIKKVVRKDPAFTDFLLSEFSKSEKDIPALATVPKAHTFDMIKKALAALETVADPKQKTAIKEIDKFLTKIESLNL